MDEPSRIPRPFRWPTRDGVTPTGQAAAWNYGCYFPATDLTVTDMGRRRTGVRSCAAPIGPGLATCYGSTRCRACRDCSRCGHCNAGQGACGVCAHHESPAN